MPSTSDPSPGLAPDSALKVLLFTDLVDSTAWKKRLGDRDYASELRVVHDRLFRELLSSCPGAIEQDNAGDGFLAIFATPGDAVSFALRFHEALNRHPWSEPVTRSGSTPATRIGIHLGEVVAYADRQTVKVTGQAVDLAARVMSLGQPGQTLLTRHAFDSARQFVREHPVSGSALSWVAHGHYRFKGNDDDPLEVFGVAAEGSATLVPPADSEKAKRVRVDEADDTGAWRPAIGLPIPRRDGWKLERQLGEGGFGEVWLARHQRTKEQRVFKFCFDADRLRSFKRELTLFKLLQSEFGERKDFVRLFDVQVEKSPYFLESEYIAEGNLGEWVERTGFDAWPVADRLRFVAEVARTVAAAHSLGIIHKDLKPSNILVRIVDGVAHPVLADFGIGVLTDRAILDRRQITATGGMNTLLQNDSSRTGTRMYSPPEAMLGKPPTTGHDVYALGVFLYQLLIGHFDEPLGTGWEESLPAESPERRALLIDDIRDATQTDIRRRIATAIDFAERIEQLPQRAEARQTARLADEAARRISALRRALAFTAAFGLIIAGAAYYAWHQRGIAVESEQDALKAHAELKGKNLELEASLRKVQERTKLALDAYSEMVFGIQNKLDDRPATRELRKELLENARTGLESILKDATRDESTDAIFVAAHIQLGDVDQELGKTREARNQYQIAFDLTKRALEADPDNRQAQRDHRICITKLGDVALRLGETAEALRLRKLSLARDQECMSREPENPMVARDLLVSREKLGTIYLTMGRPRDALAQFEAMVIIASARIEANPKDRSIRRDEADSYERLGKAQEALGLIPAALEAYRKSESISRSLLESDPESTKARRDLGVIVFHIANLQQQNKELNEARTSYLEYLQLCQVLSDADPTSRQAQRDLSLALSKLAEVALARNRPDEAVEATERSLAIRQKLADSDPDDAVARRDVAVGLNMLGNLRLARRELPLALAAYRQANDSLEMIARRDPHSRQSQTDLNISYSKLGDVTLELGQFDESYDFYLKSLKGAQKLAESDRSNINDQTGLFICLFRLGSHQKQVHEYEHAASWFSKARAVMVPWDEKKQLPGQFRNSIAQCDRQIRICTHAVEGIRDPESIYRQAEEEIPALAIMRLNVLLKSDKVSEALATMDRFAQWADKQTAKRGAHWYNAACGFARCAAASAKDQRDQLIDRTVTLLKKADEDRYFTPARIEHFRKDTDFAGIRSHAKLKAFDESLNAPKQ